MVIVYQVDTGGSMLTLSNAIVDILVAILAHPATLTLAVIVAQQIRARDGIDARVGEALVCI